MVAFAVDTALRAALSESQRVGAIGPGSLDDHLDHASAFVDAICQVEPSAISLPWQVLDLGSGGGLPGLVLADRVRSWRLTLLDGRTERIRRLDEMVEALGWRDRVATVAERAEMAAHKASLRSAFDVVVVRSFAPPAVTAECGAGFLRHGGLLVVSEPPSAGTSRWPAEGCAQLGLELAAVTALPRSFVVLRAVAPCPERLPRRVGIPTKRPLFGGSRP